MLRQGRGGVGGLGMRNGGQWTVPSAPPTCYRVLYDYGDFPLATSFAQRRKEKEREAKDRRERERFAVKVATEPKDGCIDSEAKSNIRARQETCSFREGRMWARLRRTPSRHTAADTLPSRRVFQETCWQRSPAVGCCAHTHATTHTHTLAYSETPTHSHSPCL